MNPSSEQPSNAQDKEYISVFNNTTGQILYCKKNDETNNYEVMTASAPAPKVVNLQPRFSKVCTNTFQVIIYAIDGTTQKLGKYVFRDNEFVAAPECICDACKLPVYEIKETPGNFFSSNDSPMILIGIQWIGCHIRGKNLTYVNASNGVIGVYRQTSNGLELEQENFVVRMLPNPKSVFLMNQNYFINWGFCPHIQQTIYLCQKGGEFIYLTFNKHLNHFEMIKCDCKILPTPNVKFENEKTGLLETFLDFRTGKWIGIFVTYKGRLQWRQYDLSRNEWKAGSQRMLDCRGKSTKDLLIRYNFQQGDPQSTIDLLGFNDSKRVFAESSIFGTFHWAVIHEDQLLKPFQFDLATGNFKEVSELQIFQYRMLARCAVNTKLHPAGNFEELIKQFNTHTCDKCKKNVRMIHPQPPQTHKHAKEFLSKLNAPHLGAASDLGSLPAARTISPPNFPAPPPPTVPQSTSLPSFQNFPNLPFSNVEKNYFEKKYQGSPPQPIVPDVKASFAPPPSWAPPASIPPASSLAPPASFIPPAPFVPLALFPSSAPLAPAPSWAPASLAPSATSASSTGLSPYTSNLLHLLISQQMGQNPFFQNPFLAGLPVAPDTFYNYSNTPCVNPLYDPPSASKYSYKPTFAPSTTEDVLGSNKEDPLKKTTAPKSNQCMNQSARTIKLNEAFKKEEMEIKNELRQLAMNGRMNIDMGNLLKFENKMVSQPNSSESKVPSKPSPYEIEARKIYSDKELNSIPEYKPDRVTDEELGATLCAALKSFKKDHDELLAKHGEEVEDEEDSSEDESDEMYSDEEEEEEEEEEEDLDDSNGLKTLLESLQNRLSMDSNGDI
uniref:Uncharacterized protein n=1 Tax=Caenorhabditis tropicalis TaxID=1561998 RepID=A0A1I7UYK2_9PELO